jgi:flagellar operon protein
MTEQVRAIPASPVEQVQPSRGSTKPTRSATKGQEQFAEVLQRAEANEPALIRFSSHAQRRIQQRAIPFGQSEMRRLEEAVEKAESKGARDSLILMDELALIVNVKNRVVVTAIDPASRQENVFTHIDTVVMT